MKKGITFLVIVTLCTFIFAGCIGMKASSFSMTAVDNMMTITAENADTDSKADAELEVETKTNLVFDASSLSKGKLKIVLKDADGNIKAEASVSAKETNSFSVPAGSYTVEVSVLEESTGTAEVRIESK